MKYTLGENAVSSLSIDIEYFKKFYYHEEKYSTSEIDEAIKISLVFLENSIYHNSEKVINIYLHSEIKEML